MDYHISWLASSLAVNPRTITLNGLEVSNRGIFLSNPLAGPKGGTMTLSDGVTTIPQQSSVSANDYQDAYTLKQGYTSPQENNNFSPFHGTDERKVMVAVTTADGEVSRRTVDLSGTDLYFEKIDAALAANPIVVEKGPQDRRATDGALSLDPAMDVPVLTEKTNALLTQLGIDGEVSEPVDTIGTSMMWVRFAPTMVDGVKVEQRYYFSDLIRYVTQEKSEVSPKTVYEADPALELRQQELSVEGSPGEATTTLTFGTTRAQSATLVPASQPLDSRTEITTAAVNRVVRVGTKPTITTAAEPFATVYELDSSLAAGEQKVVTPGQAITLPNTTQVTREGYTFTGWNTAADGSGTSYAAGERVTLLGDVTLYAQWTRSATATDQATASTSGAATGSTVASLAKTGASVLGGLVAVAALVGGRLVLMRRRRQD